MAVNTGIVLVNMLALVIPKCRTLYVKSTKANVDAKIAK